ncbi:MAG: bifunctional (p)ppGpp synthetase/guanosine-3',5'-bis(diphosphate) 3'-pyrophosphohydrolase, partial [Desulfobacula sp.]|nr:bifunctional (p)ppGpp synthetase/guanosine-3',5'-bis(diphosphate) 3'-pyrophosphohydrolase [Desulfobacula sp.]
VKTVKARTKIRSWINAREKERSYSLGREMCEKTFRKKNQNFNAMVKSGEIKKIADTYGFKTVDDLIAHVGFGKFTPLQVFNKALPEFEKQEAKEESILHKLVGRRKKKESTGIIVKGLDDILVRFSKCCNPLPGDRIIGYITQGQGVTIHRKGCLNVMKLSNERQIEVQWSDDFTESYPASIKVRTDDRFGLLADIASVISKYKSNILSAKTETQETGVGFFYFTLLVESTEQLRKIMSEIRKVKKVIDVKRIIRNE